MKPLPLFASRSQAKYSQMWPLAAVQGPQFLDAPKRIHHDRRIDGSAVGRHDSVDREWQLSLSNRSRKQNGAYSEGESSRAG